ncbi:saccharopine dehydrogenase NADP-binding domain-containing protein [uncultured Methanobrevibacter sp.]|uniref:saccharopine dehydrogenase NADP-binding domain-containing protein n=1 Tax=uncultured Methanobrevibacter sp. TaxID=253161 RepID=UPI00260B3821|nr:saccharopine dehydrogenase NADP-binding domain-containing protein [uncultured Methanobrevibacter sp.]
MKTLDERLKIVEKHVKDDEITIMIIGLGSVGTYLLDFLVSKNDPAIKLVVVGRNAEKMQSDVNIVRVAGLIREVNKSQIIVESGVDLNDIDSIEKAISKYDPDFIVNSSRAYPGLKYGSISWNNVRAYGIWTPLSIKFTKNIMEACDKADTNAVVINTSYSDAVIPWLKSAGKAYPDFGSGNLNHLIPRMKFAVADMLGVDDFWNVDFNFAAAHFHDVCISKEGQTEGVELPLKVYYKGEEKDLPHDEIFKACSISMPVDQKRNMMNASSNYRIISAVIDAIRTGEDQKVFSPGVFGNIGGYPVIFGYKDDEISSWIDESVFSFEEMDKANRESLALDGVEDIKDATLIYTDDLIRKVKEAFGEDLPKEVKYDDIEKTADFLIEKIITPQLNK